LLFLETTTKHGQIDIMHQELVKMLKSVELATAAAATGYRLRIVGRIEKYAKRRCTLYSTVQSV